MDNDLERSVRLLETSVNTTRRSLLKPTKKLLDLSITLKPDEVAKLMEKTTFNYNDTMNFLMDTNETFTGSIIHKVAPWKNTVEQLYTEFFEVLQGGQDVLDIIADLSRCCSDALNVIQGLKSKVAVSKIDEEIALINECNTWKLLFILYQDRLSRNMIDDAFEDFYTGLSEKLCIETLFKRDHLIRESQLVIDWLERCSADNDDIDLHFTDYTAGWENSMHQIKSAQTIAFGSSRQIISELDPDAPHYQKLPLHDLDMEDEKRLCQKVFRKIRCGKLDEAQEICIGCGHAYKAALLEGWKLYHDPNIKENERVDLNDEQDFIEHDLDPSEQTGMDVTWEDTEGNPNRDIWKCMALQYCKIPELRTEEKASVAAFCGDLQSILPLCRTWEDTLWAYMRTMVDIRVESEIRDNVNRNYKSLPESYWDQRLSLNEIFKKLESSNNPTVQGESSLPGHIIQKYIILDEVHSLMKTVKELSEDRSVSTSFLRFATHLVLFFDQIGQVNDVEVKETVLERYVQSLANMDETKLVIFYGSKLSELKQLKTIPAYLEKISKNEDQREALTFCENFGLDVLSVTKQIVENVRNRPQEIESRNDLRTKLTDNDFAKISSIDWLLFYEEQKLEAIRQCNAIIFTFLTLSKLEAAQLVFNKIPPNFIDHLQSIESNEDINSILGEYLCYKVYLEAHEAFNEWYQKFKSHPQAPENIPENAPFTEKVAHQHRLSQYQAEIDRWNLLTAKYAKNAKTQLYNVLLFPDGWLKNTKDGDYLRSTCIPEIVLLLFSVLFESGSHAECVQLADIIASEKYEIYKVYSKEKLGEILIKLCESSLALLNVKKNPWGNEAPSI